MNEINELFNDFDTNTLCVSDFNIVVRGTRVDNIVKTDSGSIQIWAGNPLTDKNAEELVLSPLEKKDVFDQIIDNM